MWKIFARSFADEMKMPLQRYAAISACCALGSLSLFFCKTKKYFNSMLIWNMIMFKYFSVVIRLFSFSFCLQMRIDKDGSTFRSIHLLWLKPNHSFRNDTHFYLMQNKTLHHLNIAFNFKSVLNQWKISSHFFARAKRGDTIYAAFHWKMLMLTWNDLVAL